MVSSLGGTTECVASLDVGGSRSSEVLGTGRKSGEEGLSEISYKNTFEFQKDSGTFFENLPDLLRPEAAAALLGMSTKTIYDWRYRPHQRKVPETLFIKLNRFLYLRTSVLKMWISSQN